MTVSGWLLLSLSPIYALRAGNAGSDARIHHSSEGLVVTRVVPKHVVELHVVDLVGGLGLEALLNDGVLLVGHLHFEVVEDGAEAGEGDEARAALILVLEVRLDQQAAVLHIRAEAHQAGDKHLLFVVVEHVLWIQDGGRLELVGPLCWLLLEVLIREDSVKVVAEGRVVDKAGVIGQGERFLQSLVLLWGQEDALSVERATELLGWKVALAKSVVVLEELVQADTVLLYNLFYLNHEWVNGALS